MVTRLIVPSAFFAILLITACQNPQSPDDLLNAVKNDVAYSKAENVNVTFSFTGDGSISPSGAQTVKKGIAFDISASPLSDYTFAGWQKGKTADKVVFENASSANTKVTVSSDNASIIATFSPKIEVDYTVPMIGAVDVPINSDIYVFFTKAVDPSSITTDSIHINKQSGSGGLIPTTIKKIDGNKVILAGPPNPTYLPKNTWLKITVESTVRDLFGNRLSKANSQNMFLTKDAIDMTSKPSNESAIITNRVTNGKLFIDSVDAEKFPDPVTTTWVGTYYDISGTPTTLVSGTTKTAFNFASLKSVTYDLPAGLLEGNWAVGIQFEGSVGTTTDLSDTVTAFDIYYDKTPPNAPSFVVQNESLKGTGSYDYIGPNSFINGNFDINIDVTATDATNLTGTTDPTKSKVGSFVVSLSPINGTETPTNYTGAPTTKVWNMGSSGKVATYIQAIDLAGNKSSPTFSKTYIIDRTPPTGTISSTVSYTNLTSVPLTLTGTDSQSGEGNPSRLFIKRVGNDIVNDGSRLAFSTSPSVTLTGGEGPKLIDIELSDPVGNVTHLTKTVQYDITPPVGTPSVSINAGAASTVSNVVTLTVNNSATDAYSGIKGYELSSDNSFWYGPYTSSSMSWTFTPGSTTRTVYIRAIDNANNVSSVGSDSILVNAAAPTGTVSIKAGATYTNTLSNTVTLSGLSANIVSYRYNANGTYSASSPITSSFTVSLPSGDGSKSVTVELTNSDGLKIYPFDSIVLDQTAPVVSSMQINSGNTYLGTLRPFITFSAHDVTSGTANYNIRRYDPSVGAYTASGTITSWVNAPSGSDATVTNTQVPSDKPVIAPFTGSKYYAVFVTDQAGNVSAGYDGITFQAPVITSSSYSPSTILLSTYSVTLVHNVVSFNAGASTNYIEMYWVSGSTTNPNVSGATYLVGNTTNSSTSITYNGNAYPMPTRYYWLRYYCSSEGGYGPYIGVGTDPSINFGKKVP